ncbi:TetR/AcrR family transcriptional regulator [Nocardia huaxiensis]|uniref:TetR/AcrR family transcriptional regulator n=1 Tax=Nocardia huaxiensis TaxID=2755382 RepID=A0A7D6ZUK7_9NOCA|nr:TetR/AcrR family transcriptional regulator [Nocardia huaxiensis]QLY29049.1 TetR/AcrR family transcriptional regulator [Nocardia huaxiensis]UFS97464.1 TetR/AcrR family transcriptional regulator [Nocardia huaxiensis]
MNSRSRQTNRRGSSTTRADLIEAAIRLLEQDGPEALQARRVAAAIGASTMAVYTHFGGMTGLLEAVAVQAFARFGAALGGIEQTDDPVADFLAMGAAYRAYALADPQRYRLMFGLTAPDPKCPPHTGDFTTGPSNEAIGTETFEHAVAAAERMIDAGHLRPDPPREVAARLWALMHGAVLLEMAGFLGSEQRSAATVLGPATADLLVGMGAAREQVERATQRANRRIERDR